jgi:GWxTD domain-containing protein
MKTLSLLVTFTLLITPLAFGQPSSQYAGWADGPVRLLMTRDEIQQWKNVQTDADAQAFIDLFWAKRDPTPATARNEFHEEFDRRVDYADNNFSTSAGRGALSDRGKALILLGPPYKVSATPGAQINGLGISAAGRSGRSAAPQGPVGDPDRQYWMYAHGNKPKFILQADFTLLFTSQQTDDWQIATTERVKPDQIFQQAVAGYIVSPNLTKAPDYAVATATTPPNTTFKSAELKTAYEQFRSANQESVGPAHLTWGEFITPEGHQFVSAELYVPAGNGIAAGQNATLISVVEDKDGHIAEVDEDPVTLMATGSDAYVDKSLQLAPGTYTATFALSADGKMLTARRATLNVDRIDVAAPGISPLILSSNVYPLQTNWQATDPFTFGGLKVVPKGDAVFAPQGDLWYFVEVRNPGLTDRGVPVMRVKIDIDGQTDKGRPVSLKFPVKDTNATALKGEKNRYALGMAIPLEGFVPGDYTIKVHVEDTMLGKSYDMEKHFRVRSL